MTCTNPFQLSITSQINIMKKRCITHIGLSLFIAVLGACGGGGDSNTSTDSGDGSKNSTSNVGNASTSAAQSTTTTTEAASIAVSPDTYSSYWGYTTQLSSTVKNAKLETLSIQPDWTSSSSAIATININGLVTHNSPGTAKISATTGNVSGVADVTTLGFKPSSLNVANEDSCIISEDGQDIWCWGKGSPLYLNRGSSLAKIQYSQALRLDKGGAVPAKTEFQSIAISTNFSCALSNSGVAYCWNQNIDVNGLAYIGTGSVTPSAKPQRVVQGELPIKESFVSIKIGTEHACALGSDGEIYCWGNRDYLSYGANGEPVTAPQKIANINPGGGRYRDFAVATQYFCAVSENGQIFCSGGALDRLKPVAAGEIPSNVKIINLKSDGLGFMVALGDDGWLYSFGSDSGRRFGIGSNDFINEGVYRLARGAIPLGVKIVNYTVGSNVNSNCAIGDNGKAYCWGGSFNGSSGDGNLTNHNNLTPVEVLRGELPAGVTFQKIGCGTYHCAAMGSDRLIYAWGYSQNVANGQTTNTATPRRLPKVDLR